MERFHLGAIFRKAISEGDEYALGKFTGRGYLEIWDVEISASGFASLGVGDAGSVAVYRGGSDLKTILETLPEQPANAIRVFVDELYDYGGYQAQVHRLCGLPWESTRKAQTGFRTLCSQFRDLTGVWSRVEGYGYLSTKKENGKRYVKHRNLIEDFRKKVRSIFRGSDQNWARTERDFTFGHGKDGERMVFISCQTYVPLLEFKSLENQRDKFPFATTAELVAEFKSLERTYCYLRNESNWRQIVSLQCHHANLNLFTDFLFRLVSDYVENEELALDPRDTKLQEWHLQRIIYDSLLYRKIARAGTETVAMLESLLDLNVAVSLQTPQDSQLVAQLSILAAELRGCTRDISRLLSRSSDDLQDDLKYLDLARNAKQTRSVQTLTLLATIFLPLSLSAGILSMQTRFKDLGNLLYDFFGVVVLLGWIAIVLLVLLYFLTSLREFESMIRGVKAYKWYVRPLITLTASGVLSIYAGLVLSSFVVGMFKDVVLGAKILGYGTAAAVLGPLVMSALLGGAVYCHHLVSQALSWVARPRMKKQRNLEDGRSHNDQSETQREGSRNVGTRRENED